MSFAISAVTMRNEVIAIAEVLRELGDKSRAMRLEALAQPIDPEELCVGVAGEVNSGKTTLINALLGSETLPRGLLPTTGVITRIGFGRVPSVHVVRKGRRERRSLQGLDSSIRIDENWLSIPDAETVEIQIDAPILSHHISFLDTPGLNDREVLTWRTLDGLEDAGIILLVLKATHLLSGRERDFVTHWLRREVSKPVVPILNFFGDVLPEEQADVLGRLNYWMSENTQTVLGTSFFVVDALAALRSVIGSKPVPTDDLLALRKALTDFPKRKRIALGRSARRGRLLAELRDCQQLDYAAPRDQTTGEADRSANRRLGVAGSSYELKHFDAQVSLRWAQVRLSFDTHFGEALKDIISRAGLGPWNTESASATLETAAEVLSSRLFSQIDEELGRILQPTLISPCAITKTDGAVRALVRAAGSREAPWPKSSEAVARMATNLWGQFRADLEAELRDCWNAEIVKARRHFDEPRIRPRRPTGRSDPIERFHFVLASAISAVTAEWEKENN